MTRSPRDQDVFSQIRSCLDAAAAHPGLVTAGVYQTEGYLRGIQGLPWEAPAAVPPAREDTAASFLHDVRKGEIALRGRVKRHSQTCLEAFESGLIEAFPGAEGKRFVAAVSKLWTRWLGTFPCAGDPDAFSRESGLKVGELLKREYEEGLAGNLAAFLMDRRLHLDGVREFLRMRGWLLGTIERWRGDSDALVRERAEILNNNFSSIVLRAQHHAGPGYAAQAAEKLSSLMSELDRAVRNLSATEPEAASFLAKNRATVITRALHSGDLDYGLKATEAMPRLLEGFERRVAASAPKTADYLRANRRTFIYRALTNGLLKTPR